MAEQKERRTYAYGNDQVDVTELARLVMNNLNEYTSIMPLKDKQKAEVASEVSDIMNGLASGAYAFNDAGSVVGKSELPVYDNGVSPTQYAVYYINDAIDTLLKNKKQDKSTTTEGKDDTQKIEFDRYYAANKFMNDLPSDEKGNTHIEDYIKIKKTKNDNVDPITGKNTYTVKMDFSPVYSEWDRYLKDFRYKLSHDEFKVPDEIKDETILDIDKLLTKPREKRTIEDYKPFFFPLIAQDKVVEYDIDNKTEEPLKEEVVNDGKYQVTIDEDGVVKKVVDTEDDTQLTTDQYEYEKALQQKFNDAAKNDLKIFDDYDFDLLSFRDDNPYLADISKRFLTQGAQIMDAVYSLNPNYDLPYKNDQNQLTYFFTGQKPSGKSDFSWYKAQVKSYNIDDPLITSTNLRVRMNWFLTDFYRQFLSKTDGGTSDSAGIEPVYEGKGKKIFLAQGMINPETGRCYALSVDTGTGKLKILKTTIKDLIKQINENPHTKQQKLNLLAKKYMDTLMQYDSNKSSDFLKAYNNNPGFEIDKEKYLMDYKKIAEDKEKAKQEVTNEAASSVNKMQSGGTVYLTESEILTNKSNKKPKSDIQQKYDETKENHSGQERFLTGQEPAYDDVDGYITDLNTRDTIRLFAVGVDVISLLSNMFPGPGTVVNATTSVISDALNAGADFTDDQLTFGQAFCNTALNVGLDAFGLIPYVGVAGKYAKISKHLPKLKKAIGAVLTAATAHGMFNNADGALNCLDKLNDGKLDEIKKEEAYELINCLTSILGIGTAGFQYYKQAKRTNQKLNNSDAEMEFNVTSNGDSKTVKLSEGEIAEINDIGQKNGTAAANKKAAEIVKTKTNDDTIDLNNFEIDGMSYKDPNGKWYNLKNKFNIGFNDLEYDKNLKGYAFNASAAKEFENIQPKLESSFMQRMFFRLETGMSYDQAKILHENYELKKQGIDTNANNTSSSNVSVDKKGGKINPFSQARSYSSRMIGYGQTGIKIQKGNENDFVNDDPLQQNFSNSILYNYHNGNIYDYRTGLPSRLKLHFDKDTETFTITDQTGNTIRINSDGNWTADDGTIINPKKVGLFRNKQFLSIFGDQANDYETAYDIIRSFKNNLGKYTENYQRANSDIDFGKFDDKGNYITWNLDDLKKAIVGYDPEQQTYKLSFDQNDGKLKYLVGQKNKDGVYEYNWVDVGNEGSEINVNGNRYQRKGNQLERIYTYDRSGYDKALGLQNDQVGDNQYYRYVNGVLETLNKQDRDELILTDEQRLALGLNENQHLYKDGDTYNIYTKDSDGNNIKDDRVLKGDELTNAGVTFDEKSLRAKGRYYSSNPNGPSYLNESDLNINREKDNWQKGSEFVPQNNYLNKAIESGLITSDQINAAKNATSSTDFYYARQNIIDALSNEKSIYDWNDFSTQNTDGTYDFDTPKRQKKIYDDVDRLIGSWNDETNTIEGGLKNDELQSVLQHIGAVNNDLLRTDEYSDQQATLAEMLQKASATKPENVVTPPVKSYDYLRQATEGANAAMLGLQLNADNKIRNLSKIEYTPKQSPAQMQTRVSTPSALIQTSNNAGQTYRNSAYNYKRNTADAATGLVADLMADQQIESARNNVNLKIAANDEEQKQSALQTAYKNAAERTRVADENNELRSKINNYNNQIDANYAKESTNKISQYAKNLITRLNAYHTEDRDNALKAAVGQFDTTKEGKELKDAVNEAQIALTKGKVTIQQEYQDAYNKANGDTTQIKAAQQKKQKQLQDLTNAYTLATALYQNKQKDYLQSYLQHVANPNGFSTWGAPQAGSISRYSNTKWTTEPTYKNGGTLEETKFSIRNNALAYLQRFLKN